MNSSSPLNDFDSANAALLELEARFSHWRKNKTYSRESIPIELLQAAQALTQHIEDRHVRARLGISTDQLKRAQQINEPVKTDFVQVQTQACEAQPLRVEMQLPNGARVSIDGLERDPICILSQLLENVHDRT